MSNPEIDIFWKSCTWRRSHRRLVKPFVESAISLAYQTAEHIGIEYEQPKVARIKRCGNSYPAVAENEDATGFSLFVRVDDYRRRKVATKFGAYVMASVHELTHSARYERFDEWNLLEEIASEGLAHVAEDIASNELGVNGRLPYGDLIEYGYGSSDIKQSMYCDYLQSLDSEIELERVMDKWFDWSSPYVDEGSTIGIIEVQKRIHEGSNINEMLDWPPEQVLDLS